MKQKLYKMTITEEYSDTDTNEYSITPQWGAIFEIPTEDNECYFHSNDFKRFILFHFSNELKDLANSLSEDRNDQD